VALRGNGTHIIAHITALAKIIPQWGTIDVFSGGSSATITTFFYESMVLNPAVQELNEESKAEALALMLKSLVGYAQEALSQPEWRVVLAFSDLAVKFQENGILGPNVETSTNPTEKIKAVLNAYEFKYLINPEVESMLSTNPGMNYGGLQNRIREVQKSISSLTDLDASEADVFFRPGLVNFPAFVEIIGHVADFYAGVGVEPTAFKDFFKYCASGTTNQLWTELSSKSTPGATCGDRFSQMVRTWKATNNGKQSTRLSDSPGKGVESIMITSVVEDTEAINRLKKYEISYQSDGKRRLDFNFADVKFGYWSSTGVRDSLIATWSNSSRGEKSQKAIWLGHANSWREILEKSPREPSLGKYTVFGPNELLSGALSLGGWADLHPTDVLREAGCDETIYITRRTDETPFITKGPPFSDRKPFGVAELLGLNESDYNKIYNLDAPDSAFSYALRQATRVWCTDWNQFSALQQRDIAMDAWNAPIITIRDNFSRWPNADISGQKIRGCN